MRRHVGLVLWIAFLTGCVLVVVLSAVGFGASETLSLAPLPVVTREPTRAPSPDFTVTYCYRESFDCSTGAPIGSILLWTVVSIPDLPVCGMLFQGQAPTDHYLSNEQFEPGYRQLCKSYYPRIPRVAYTIEKR